MAHTKLHKELGKWRAGIIDETERLTKYWDRSNFDKAEDMVRRNRKKEKIADRELDEIANTRQISAWFSLFGEEE